MGYEVVYHYHERQEDGKYNTEETKQMKKKVGNPTDDIPLEQLAATIRAQLARRKIWIVDIEIFEYSKKKLSFRETDDGSIVIKNKKFSPNNGSFDLIVSDDDEAPQIQAPNINLAALQTLQQTGQANVNLAAPIRPIAHYIFDPDLDPTLQIEAKRKNLRFTPGKKYPVYQIDSPTPAQALLGATQVFHVDDDTGRRKKVASEYFLAITSGGLVGDNQLLEGGSFSKPVPVNGQRGPRLSFENQYIEDQQNDMPDLRSNGKKKVTPPPRPQVPARAGRAAVPQQPTQPATSFEAYGVSEEEFEEFDLPDVRSGNY